MYRRLPPLLLLLGIGWALLLVLVSAPAPARAAGDLAAPGWGEERSSTYPASSRGDAAAVQVSNVITRYTYLPFIAKPETCPAIPGESYATLSVNPPPTDRPAEVHADLNLALRGYELTNAFKGLVDISGPVDPGAPQLPGLFADNRTGVFNAVYQVYDWNWSCNCRGDLIANPVVTLAGLAVTPDETLHVPGRGVSSGDGYEVLVLYASPERITLKYTRDDNVVLGYTIHVENVCVEPSLLALYETWNSTGRSRLPALRAGQAFGRARGGEIEVAIRDSGAFMDPRSRKDWWRGR
jgi:hypothetical protein